MTQLNLAGVWSLSDDSGDYACNIDLPCDGITALHDAGLIPDPYWGRNEYDLRWIAERDWSAKRVFTLTDTNVDLVLSSVDTVVTVRVNGTAVLNAQNSFRDYRVSLADAAQIGENTIEVVFHSSVKAAQALQDAHPFFLPWQEGNSPIPNGNMLRKVQCDFGWDWNIALAPFGIYGDMRIAPSAAPRIDRLAITQDHSDGVAKVTITAHVENTDEMVSFALAGHTVSARPVHGVCTARISVENPDLWWPAGQGEQHLYDLKVTVATAVETRRIGLRDMALVTTPDETGLGFKFSVNGRDVFAKGSNWIPADALFGRITPEKTRDLLLSAKDANMNMIRIWGGGRYEPTWFYDICDEMGLMVWQDFMFACNIYPSTPAFLAEVRAEVHDNVARLHHHACIAVWCGDNELIGALTWFDVTRKDRDRYLVNYDRLNRCIEDALKHTDPTANWWPSSPSPGPLSFGDVWHDDRSGDMHFWSVWHEGRDFDHYRDVAPRFCSEFGFQSYPSMDIIRGFADPADFNIASPVLESHQKNAGGNARIAETMFRYFRWPAKFEDFVYLSQVQQGLAIKTAVTHWRSLKPHCMGTLIWQLNDTWPVCSWASLDYGGGWKLMHHMAKEFYQPVLVTAVPSGEDIILRGINDTPADVSIAVEAVAVSVSGATRPLGKATVTVGAAAADLMTVALSDLRDDEVLAMDWTGSDGTSSGDIFAPKPWKSYDLQPSGLRQTVSIQPDGTYTIALSASTAPAFFTSVEASVPGRFSQQAFTLVPGYDTTVTFTPTDPNTKPDFTLRDLHSATYA